MHELSIVQSLVSMADSYARQNGAKSVKYITLEIGGLTGVIPRYVSDYYPDVCQGTLLEGSELKIEEVAPAAFCRECGATFPPAEHDAKCPACGAQNYEVIEGDKLILKELAFE